MMVIVSFARILSLCLTAVLAFIARLVSLAMRPFDSIAALLSFVVKRAETEPRVTRWGFYDDNDDRRIPPRPVSPATSFSKPVSPAMPMAPTLDSRRPARVCDHRYHVDLNRTLMFVSCEPNIPDMIVQDQLYRQERQRGTEMMAIKATMKAIEALQAGFPEDEFYRDVWSEAVKQERQVCDYRRYNDGDDTLQ
uniref:Uncharacterized protein n=1 Tax=Spongospora subterranea TaxID=70186 RepID=A0A0H5QJB6_9EUKA|eukprot:CRZ02205.1 hypothetical protein [Spongospora subterranea]